MLTFDTVTKLIKKTTANSNNIRLKVVEMDGL